MCLNFGWTHCIQKVYVVYTFWLAVDLVCVSSVRLPRTLQQQLLILSYRVSLSPESCNHPHNWISLDLLSFMTGQFWLESLIRW